MGEIGKVLNWEEIEALPKNLQQGAKRDFINSVKKRAWESWDKKEWSNVIEEILRIPEEIDSELKTMGEAAIFLLFYRVKIRVKEVKLVGKFLRKTGTTLSQKPWREKFLEMTKTAGLPYELEKMIEAVGEAGMSREEYKSVLRETVSRIAEKTETEIVEETRVSMGCLAADLIRYMKKIGIPIDGYKEKFLWIGDNLLARGSIEKACEVYKEIQETMSFEASEARKRIMEFHNRYYDRGKISYHRMQKKIKKIAEKELGIDIRYS